MILYNDPFATQFNLIKNRSDKIVIFDVGSFDGTLALKYKKLFPSAEIYCFEPFIESFRLLEKNLKDRENFHLFNLGFFSSNESKTFFVNQSPSTSSLLKPSDSANKVWGKNLFDHKQEVTVELKTLDFFLDKKDLCSIDILKIDVQGSEYDVLLGAENSLKRGVVKIIYIEIMNMNVYNQQKKIHEIYKLLDEFGFVLFGTYSHTFYKSGQLRQFDAIFVWNLKET